MMLTWQNRRWKWIGNACDSKGQQMGGRWGMLPYALFGKTVLIVGFGP